jgi:hypothetical protein
VKRQTKESRFSYWEWTWEELEELVRSHFDERTPGYRDGVVLVPVPPQGFYSAIVELHTGDSLRTEYIGRTPTEEPAMVTTVNGRAKTPAGSVNVVLYRADVLDEDNDRSTDADWEIISINASPDHESIPMHPLTMARNELHLEGGTQGTYSKDEYMRSIIYWSKHAMVSSQA